MKTTTAPNKRIRRQDMRRTCSGCEMPANDWPGAGVVRNGERYCCEGCADGTGCDCEPRVRAVVH